MVSNVEKDKFTLILEPNTNDGSINDPILNLACLDSSLGNFIYIIISNKFFIHIYLFI
jgi:hypothetical protein